ncbi:MAG: hypothetical protein D6692_10020, partial [Planctomycetota bacterium]
MDRLSGCLAGSHFIGRIRPRLQPPPPHLGKDCEISGYTNENAGGSCPNTVRSRAANARPHRVISSTVPGNAPAEAPPSNARSTRTVL